MRNALVTDFPSWRNAARTFLNANIPPEDILWESPDNRDLDWSSAPSDSSIDKATHRVPKEFVPLAERISCHRNPRKWSVLYRVLWRLAHGESHLLKISVDPDIHLLQTMDKAVRRDLHKMRAFVRFRSVGDSDRGEWYVAWFQPDHLIVERNAPFFRDRFHSMHWSILTPDRCAHWDETALTFTPGIDRQYAPAEDNVENLWLRYYSSIFNPARVKIQAMESEMPRRYWKNLPEAALIPSLIQDAPTRVQNMMHRSQGQSGEPILGPPIEELLSGTGRSLREIKAIACSCTACPLYANATHTVFGEGPANADVVFVGEQPGDQEDLAGQPFVGPAGKLFDRALAEAGIDRSKVYVTNAVKHFKWEPRGKRRLHQTPSGRDIAACRPWLVAELEALRPRVLVCLGATAAHAVLGPGIRILKERGNVRSSEFCAVTFITVHPSLLLRTPELSARQSAYGAFVQDLRHVRQLAADTRSRR